MCPKSSTLLVYHEKCMLNLFGSFGMRIVNNSLYFGYDLKKKIKKSAHNKVVLRVVLRDQN